jgi:hypothetical protein
MKIRINLFSFLLISCKSLQKKQAFEMTPPKERHQADREWVGGATPFLIIVVIFTGFLAKAFTGQQVMKGKKGDKWPFIEFTYVKAYLYNLDNQLHGNHAVIKDNQLDKTVVGDGVLLDKNQVETILQVINNDITGLIQGLSKSYIPHHGIVFYDNTHQPVAYITFCFDCEALRIYPGIDFPKKNEELSEQEIKRLLKLLERCKQIIAETKLPIFDSPFDYREYGKNQ